MKELYLYDFTMTGNFDEVRTGMPKSTMIQDLSMPDSDMDDETQIMRTCILSNAYVTSAIVF